jgi:hypothetical protein
MIANRAASRAFDQIGTIVVDQASIGIGSKFKTPVFLAWLQAWPDRTKISLLTVPVGNEVA